jgi:hypothetical protein
MTLLSMEQILTVMTNKSLLADCEARAPPLLCQRDSLHGRHQSSNRKGIGTVALLGMS